MLERDPNAGLDMLVADDVESLSRTGAELIIRELERRPSLLLCASAGGTPTGTYAGLAQRFQRQPELFRRLRVLQIDEWGGLPAGCPATCHQDLQAKLLQPLHVNPNRYVGFQSEAVDPEAECRRVHQWLVTHGPIDLCILGLGVNGHVAMNEPGPACQPHAHLAKLARSSLGHPMLKDLLKKPRFGLTIGVGDILRAGKILLLVSGSHKRDALRQLLEPRVSTLFPASLLWLHPAVTVLCDRAALGRDLKQEKGRKWPKSRKSRRL